MRGGEPVFLFRAGGNFEEEASMTTHGAQWSLDQAIRSTPLLVCRMIGLDLDVDELREADPAVYRALQTQCNACADRAECASAIMNTGVDPAWQNWRLYCPNSATLALLSRARARSVARAA
jgi:hypothetical protein